MAVTGISSIWFSVTDWERAESFYEKVLGLRSSFLNDATGVAAYCANATDPPIFLIKQHGANTTHSAESGAAAERGGTVGFNVADAGEIIKRVAAFGGSVSDQVSDGTDTRVYIIYDSDGNVLELTELKNPESDKKQNGM